MTRRVLIDTNAYSALFAGDTAVADVLADVEEVLLSAIVVGELLDGFAKGSRRQQNRLELDEFRQSGRTREIDVTSSTAEWFAEVKQQLKRKGKPIPINDVWIAAQCLEHGAALLSFDTHFGVIEGLLRR